jgi:hypothetical protein
MAQICGVESIDPLRIDGLHNRPVASAKLDVAVKKTARDVGSKGDG